STGRVWLWPQGFMLDGYKRIFNNAEIYVGYRNSIFYTVAGTLINLIVTVPAAYALSRRDMPWRGFFLKLFLFTMFFGGGLIPTYNLVRTLGMRNTVWSILLTGACSTTNLIVTRTYFVTSIPGELEEAAEIDGCHIFQLFGRIILPLSMPIIAVMALLYGVGHWNSYFNAMIYLSDRSLFPLQIILREILIVQQMNTSQMLSAMEAEAIAQQSRMAELVKYGVMIVATVPVLIVYPLLQKHFVKGIMIGALKG
ncbi:MAG: carbohydrate ABC transporter permease, partial [Clostridiales bacterium]|nr:carbohydrate ABC transporter permease [Clostridiales bacterium]